MGVVTATINGDMESEKETMYFNTISNTVVELKKPTYYSVCVCVFIKLHITAQSGLVILVILCHSR